MRTFCGLTTDGMLEYLAAIYQLAEISDRVTTTAIAEQMCVSLPAASSMLKRLEDSGFAERSNVDGITLTQQGTLAALQLLRRHRLLEVFLMQVMGFTWDQVEAEAHRLEHAISAEFEDRMDALCGYPTHCPHGDPIPKPDGTLPTETLVAVPQATPGMTGILRRVASRDASVLRYLSRLKLTPGCLVQIVEVAPFNGPITLEIQPAPQTTSALSQLPVNSLHNNGLHKEEVYKNGQHSALPNGAGAPASVTTQILGAELAEKLFLVPHAPVSAAPATPALSTTA